MESVKHQIEYKRLDEIRPYDNNPRRNDEAAKAVANSIKEFGFQSPIIVDRDGVIIAGHTRYKAARRLKLQEVPVIVAAELDPEKVKALRIADNSTGEVAEWDLQLLVQELTGIEYDMTDFGLNLQIKIDEEVKEDDFTAEPPEQPITQRGDIWLLGDHRVMCGDSTSPQDVERLTEKHSSVIRCDKPPRNAAHPTMKPVVLCGRLIKNSSLPGQTVLDLFGGSGSTLIACEQLSRKCYTMEYDPRYVDVIVQRWEDFTGEKAVRLK